MLAAAVIQRGQDAPCSTHRPMPGRLRLPRLGAAIRGRRSVPRSVPRSVEAGLMQLREDVRFTAGQVG
jgi:hypothetical protein